MRSEKLFHVPRNVIFCLLQRFRHRAEGDGGLPYRSHFSFPRLSESLASAVSRAELDDSKVGDLKVPNDSNSRIDLQTHGLLRHLLVVVRQRNRHSSLAVQFRSRSRSLSQSDRSHHLLLRRLINIESHSGSPGNHKPAKIPARCCFDIQTVPSHHTPSTINLHFVFTNRTRDPLNSNRKRNFSLAFPPISRLSLATIIAKMENSDEKKIQNLCRMKTKKA